MTTPRLSVLVAATALALAGCGSDESAAPDPPTTTPRPERLVLTIDDHGTVVAVAPSTQLSLVLGDRYHWTTPRASGAPVEANEVVSDAPTSAQQWELALSESGRSVLESRGSPACRPTTPGCPPAERDFRVTLDIGP